VSRVRERPYAFRFYVLTIAARPMRIASMRALVARLPSNRRAPPRHWQ
jgi:hypothetical protein